MKLLYITLSLLLTSGSIFCAEVPGTKRVKTNATATLQEINERFKDAEAARQLQEMQLAKQPAELKMTREELFAQYTTEAVRLAELKKRLFRPLEHNYQQVCALMRQSKEKLKNTQQQIQKLNVDQASNMIGQRSQNTLPLSTSQDSQKEN